MVNQFKKKKDFLVCIDSDGCAINTMTIKHIKCFGPCLVEIWKLQKCESEILDLWNRVNLYSLTRGINRFQGLVLALEEVNEKYKKIEDMQSLTAWIKETEELSEASLMKQIHKFPTECLVKTLQWSQAVNRRITELSIEEKQPFEGVKEVLEEIHQYADIAIVSSANPQAVQEEWEEHALLNHVDIAMAQDAGTKAACIEKLLALGYENDNVIMVGDAKGDFDAAKTNHVHYYPILVNHEVQSWKSFIPEGMMKLINHTYTGEYEAEKEKMFLQNLSK